MIGDASDETIFQRNSECIQKYQKEMAIVHLRYPERLTNAASTSFMLKEVTTPYSVWAGDDDFLIPRQMETGVHFLNANSDYNLVCGISSWIYIEESRQDKISVSWARLGVQKAFEWERPSQRIFEYCTPVCFPNTFAIQRTQNIREISCRAFDLGLCTDYVHNYIHEITNNIVSLIRGKQKCLDALYHVMMRHTQKFGHSKHIDFFECALQWNWNSNIRNTVHWWAEELVTYERIPLDQAKQIAASIFFKCIMVFMDRYQLRVLEGNGLVPNCSRLRGLFDRLSKADIYSLKKMWRRVRLGKNKLPLSALLNAQSKYHSDFMSVYNLLMQ